jgi:hypothetical protein
MNKKKYFTIVTEILEERFGKDKIDLLRENAIGDGHDELEDRSAYEEWVADFCLDQICDLFEDYGVATD